MSKRLYQTMVPVSKVLSSRIFVMSYGIKHTSTSPYHHQANGQVEQCMRIIKGVLKKNSKVPWMSLLIWRSTPVDRDMKSPAELLNGHIYQSNLLLVQRTSEQNQSHKEKILVKHTKSNKDYHDGNAKELRLLSKGAGCFV